MSLLKKKPTPKVEEPKPQLRCPKCNSIFIGTDCDYCGYDPKREKK